MKKILKYLKGKKVFKKGGGAEWGAEFFGAKVFPPPLIVYIPSLVRIGPVVRLMSKPALHGQVELPYYKRETGRDRVSLVG